MKKIAIIGLGYVGLPLAVEFAKKRAVVGFDIKPERIKELNEGHDPTLEVSDEDLKAVLLTSNSQQPTANGLYITSLLQDIQDCQIYIVPYPLPPTRITDPISLHWSKPQKLLVRYSKMAISSFTSLPFILVLPKKIVYLCSSVFQGRR